MIGNDRCLGWSYATNKGKKGPQGGDRAIKAGKVVQNKKPYRS